MTVEYTIAAAMPGAAEPADAEMGDTHIPHDITRARALLEAAGFVVIAPGEESARCKRSCFCRQPAIGDGRDGNSSL
jgi:hypothetical protein